MPVPDFAGVMWGYVLGGIATNYVLVEDNYVVFVLLLKEVFRRLRVITCVV